LSVSQQALWISWELDPGQTRYLIPYAFRVTGTLEVPTLRLAARELGARYPWLRARVTQTLDGPELTWSQAPPIPVLERRIDGDLDEAVLRAGQRPFDLRSGPLARIEVLLGEGRTVLLVCVHHIVFDGGSLPTLLAQLRRVYQGEELESSPGADLLTAFARRQAALAEGPDGEQHRAFWRRYLAESKRSARARLPAGPDAGSRTLMSRWLGPETNQKIAQRAGELSATKFDFFFAGFFLLMRRYLGEEELSIAIPFHGRVGQDMRSAVGFFSNVLPISQRIDHGWTYGDMIQAVHKNVRSTLPYGELPMATINSEVVKGDAVPPVLFQYWNASLRTDVDVRALPLGGTDCTLELLSIFDQADSDLTVMVREDSAGTSLVWKDPDGVLGPALIAAMADDYESLLRDMASDPRSAIGDGAAGARLDLPRTRSARPGATGLGDADIGALPASRLLQMARAEGCRVDDVLLAALATLLSWYTGQDAFAVGVATGAMHATAVLHTHQDQDFRDLLRAIAWEGDQARPDGDGVRGRHDVLFRCAAPGSREPLPGDFDLCLDTEVHDTTIRARLLFDERCFEPWQAHAMAGDFARLLSSALDRPDTAIGEFEPLSEEERRRQIVEWNDTDAGYPAAVLPALVLSQARLSPDATALVDGPQRRSYGDMTKRATQMARAMVAAGIRPGELVALLLPRSLIQVEAILAILLAGGAYLALDPGTPAERARFILSDAGVLWAITDQAGGRTAAGLVGESVRLLDIESLLAGRDDVDLPDVKPEQPAYCIYTSGTTGRPKGVVVSHKNLVQLIRNDASPFDFGADDVWTLFHPFSFDVSAWETFGCLSSGGRLVVVSEAEARDSQRFWRLVRRERTTVLNLTPSAFSHLQLVAEAEPGSLDHLRYVIFAGEKLSPQTLGRWMREHPNTHLVNMYGITETAVLSTVRFVTQDDVSANRSNIGLPLPTTTIHLVDPRNRGRLLPVGAVGEILVGGVGVTGGYLGRDDLTRERFIADPFGSGIVFCSGDLARRNPDGTVEYIGRRDDQVKVRGYRIEPAEIESCLRAQDGVADAVVQLDEAGGDRLVAFVRPDSAEQRPSAAQLRKGLSELLPEYMIPTEFLLASEFPLTANGKLDRRRLRDSAGPMTQADGPPPRTATAQALATIWTELLGEAEISGNSSFFEHGGNSLRVGKLVNQVERQLKTRLQLRAVFDHPRLQELADYIDEQLAAGQPSHRNNAHE
jgi:amino acid adenylation domain-containing protein